jgi:hypothetical protein
MKNSSERKERIEALLTLIGGLEVSILTAQEEKDWDFLKVLKSKQKNYYERLRRVSYGLTEERTLPAEV